MSRTTTARATVAALAALAISLTGAAGIASAKPASPGSGPSTVSPSQNVEIPGQWVCFPDGVCIWVSSK
ncbi:hypothetical protein [Rhodococcus oxybenzonivorans]|uniref:hypothetical protein n=1 Tax=Rhodococcus oxybenzonivorans TaxID=1990687 RepID=UPI0013A53DFB|nr:hypothetical protein [Rhodococcus oxybenzonivorans]